MDTNKLDAFESIFRSADKPRFEPGRIELAKALIVTDQTAEHHQTAEERARQVLDGLEGDAPEEFALMGPESFRTVAEFLERLGQAAPDLVVTHRNLFEDGYRPQHSLGIYVDEMTQATPYPVLLLPRPDLPEEKAILGRTSQVLAVTDHMAGDSRIVNFAVHFTAPGGKCILSHIEQGRVFERYMNVIEKIPSIETENARKVILDQLLKEPRDFIASCIEVLQALGGVDVELEAVVELGHTVDDYRRLLEQHKVNLLVMETCAPDQLAMDPRTYSLAIEFKRRPLLLI